MEATISARSRRSPTSPSRDSRARNVSQNDDQETNTQSVTSVKITKDHRSWTQNGRCTKDGIRIESVDLIWKNSILRHCKVPRVCIPDNILDCSLKPSRRRLTRSCIVAPFRRGDMDCVLQYVKLGKVSSGLQKSYRDMLQSIIVLEQLRNLQFHVVNQTSNFQKLLYCVCIKVEEQSSVFNLFSGNMDKKCMSHSPLFLVFEFPDAGVPVEEYCFGMPQQMESAFMQITLAVAIAETALEFEHRNLLLDNILIKQTTKENLPFILASKQVILSSRGIEVTIVGMNTARLRHNKSVIYFKPTDLERRNRYLQKLNLDKEDSASHDWSTFKPETNVRYLADILKWFVKEANTRSFGSNQEHKTPKLLHQWQRLLHYCATAKEFARRMFGLELAASDFSSDESVYNSG